MTYVTGIHSRFLNNRMMNCSKGMLADQAKKIGGDSEGFAAAA
jgi:hypothetical protein